MPSISISRENDTRVKADITVNADELKPAEAKAIEKISAQAEIKGFRKGKAPGHLIRQKFASDIRLETLFALVDLHLADVEKKIEERVYRLVRIEDVQEKGEKMSFAVKLDLFPRVEIGKLKVAQLTRHIAAIDNADVEKEIQDRLLRFATFEDAPADAGAELADKLTVDFEIWIDDAPSGEVNKDYVFDLGSGTLSRELEQQIADKKGKVSEEFKLKKDLKAQQEDNKTRSYEIVATIKKIQKPKRPELTDSFVIENFKSSTTVAEFKDKLRIEVGKRFDIAQIRVETDQALKVLEKAAKYYLSESFLDTKLDEFAAERKIEKGELTVPQIENLKKALAEREQPNLLMRQLIQDAEKFHQKKNKTQDSYIDAFKKYIRTEITAFEGLNEKSGDLVAELDRAIDAMVEGKTNQSPWESLVNSYLTVFSREFLFKYFDDEGIVKKGKKLSYKELVDLLGKSAVAEPANV